MMMVEIIYGKWFANSPLYIPKKSTIDEFLEPAFLANTKLSHAKNRFFNVCGSPGTIEISIDRHSNFTLKKDVEGGAWVPLLDDHLKETSKRPMQ